MKICFLTHNLRQDNGAGVFSVNLIGGLQKKLNAEITVLTTSGSGHALEVPMLHPGKLKLLKSFLAIRKIFRGCDIIHAIDFFPYGVVAVFFSLGLNKKIIIGTFGSGAIEPMHKRFLLRFIMHYAYWKADFVVAPSNFIKNKLTEEINNLPVEVIYPGVDFSHRNKISHAGNARDFSSYKPYVLSVGSLFWRKGYKLSINAFAKAREEIKDLNYLIVGKRHDGGKYYSRMQDEIIRLGLEKNVFIMEDINDGRELESIYRNAELFLLLTQSVNNHLEGFGIVFLEAASFGLPIVGSNEGGVVEAVADGKNGILVNPRDISAAAGALIKILKDDKLKNQFSEESLRFVKNFSWDSKVAEYAELYKKLLK